MSANQSQLLIAAGSLYTMYDFICDSIGADVGKPKTITRDNLIYYGIQYINFIGAVYENIRIFEIHQETYDLIAHRIGRDHFEYIDNILIFINEGGIMRIPGNHDEKRADCYRIILEAYNTQKGIK